MTKLAQWLEAATPFERKSLIKLAKISEQTLYFLLNGKRKASAEVAGRMAGALAEIKGAADHLPEVTRADICEACAKCPYAQKVLGKEKT